MDFLQASPDRLARSILLLDAKNPWGGGACPPAGDLRAPRDALLAAADIVLRVGDGASEHEIASRLVACRYADGRSLALDELKRLDFGLILAIARPSRVARALARHGLTARGEVRFGDHEAPARGKLTRLVEKTPKVDPWLTTENARPSSPPPWPVRRFSSSSTKSTSRPGSSIGLSPIRRCPSSPARAPW